MNNLHEQTFNQHLHYLTTEIKKSENNYHNTDGELEKRRELNKIKNYRDFLKLANLFFIDKTLSIANNIDENVKTLDYNLFRELNYIRRHLTNYFENNYFVKKYKEKYEEDIDYKYLGELYFYIKSTKNDYKTGNLGDLLDLYRKMNRKYVENAYKSLTCSPDFIESGNILFEEINKQSTK